MNLTVNETLGAHGEDGEVKQFSLEKVAIKNFTERRRRRDSPPQIDIRTPQMPSIRP
jgi:hypothetical protein